MDKSGQTLVKLLIFLNTVKAAWCFHFGTERKWFYWLNDNSKQLPTDTKLPLDGYLGLGQSDHINGMITFSGIRLSGFHCNPAYVWNRDPYYQAKLVE